jgi:sulfatase maturation enzyme AslB (radical SAM superfamily)
VAGRLQQQQQQQSETDDGEEEKFLIECCGECYIDRYCTIECGKKEDALQPFE